MAITEKNILNNWFITGAKPTQEQFWNWQDSYWHKTETIPQSQIQDLDKTLENKADASVLDAKANADASGLGEANVLKWKEALGVGEVPDNMATIDKDGVLGDAYAKTQVDDLLQNKLSKPLIDDDGQNYPFVVLVDEMGDSAKAPAGDLGKNLANADLTTTGTRTFTQAHIYTHNTAGYHYYIIGLANKSADPTFNLLLAQNSNGQTAVSNGKAVLENLMASLPSVKDERTGNYDLSHNTYLVYDPITKSLKVSDRPQIVSNFNVPSQINISYPSTIANSNYTPSPTTPQDIRETFDMIKRLENGYDFTPVTPDMWILRTMADEKIAPYSSWRVPRDINQTSLNGTLHLKGFRPPNDLVQNPNFTSSVFNENSFWTAYLNKEFPSDKDWILRFRIHSDDALPLNERGAFWGFSELKETTDKRSNLTDIIIDGYSYQYGVFKNGEILITEGYYVYCIKKGSKLSFFVYNPLNGVMKVNTIDYASSMKYFRMASEIFNSQKMEMGVLKTTYFNEIAYWIQP